MASMDDDSWTNIVATTRVASFPIDGVDISRSDESCLEENGFREECASWSHLQVAVWADFDSELADCVIGVHLICKGTSPLVQRIVCNHQLWQGHQSGWSQN